MRYVVLLIMLCFIFAGCATTELKPVTTNGFLFEEDEMGLWLRAEEEQKVINESGLIYYKDEELEAYLNEIVEKLQPLEVLEHIPFKINIIRNPYLNAFSLPNGSIYIHTGMVAKMDNEAQLATLLAHEMIHCTHRHSIKGFRDLKNKTAIFATFQVAFGGFGAYGNLAILFGTAGTMASITGYSRELEEEADMEGLKLMVNAGYDPEESPKLFEYLKEELEEDKERKEPFFFGSHPKLQERIESYQNILKTKYPGQKRGIRNSDRFLKNIHMIILDNARLDLKLGRFNIAQKGIEKYLAIKPDDAKAYYLLGEVFRKRCEEGDIEKAKKNYQKAISVDSTYPYSYKGIGLIHYKQGEIFFAKESLEQYLSLLPQAFDRAYIEGYIKHCNEGGTQ
jgi:predicted Zn-dependent protease